MADIFPVDYTTNIGRVRKYIPDVIQLPDPKDPLAEPSYMWPDEAIQSFIDDETSNAPESVADRITIFRAAASILIATANNENLILKKITTDDLVTDGPSVSKAMLATAQELRKRADDLEFTAGAEETFTIVPSPYYGADVRTLWGL
jgi:hypothetical protein